MRFLRLIAVALVMAAVAFAAGLPRESSRPARAETTDSIAIWCGFLVGFIGNPATACDGLSAAEIALLADALGDEDGTLEPEDLAPLDLDANQITDGGAGVMDEIYVIAFVDEDGVVTFDAGVGVGIEINAAAGGPPPNADANAETCSVADDTDCDPAVLADGDGVVVATVFDGSASRGDSIDIVVFQADNPFLSSTQTVDVVGAPINVDLVLVESSIQSSAPAECAFGDVDATDPASLSDPTSTLALARVVDVDDRELARILVTFSSSDPNIVEIGDSTFVTVDTTGTWNAGSIALAVICGGDQTGEADIEADIGVDDDFASIVVVGEPANIELTATPSTVLCDGSQTATVTAAIQDENGDFVANGTLVRFDTFAVGTMQPIQATTTDGFAQSMFSGVSAFTVGVPVYVTAGDVTQAILIICEGFDTDGDGMPNTFESSFACLDPAAPDATGDPDADAVTSGDEYPIGSNPCAFDTDSDGCGDGVEIGLTPQLGGDRDPVNQWDFFDVPVPALAPGDASGTRNKLISLADVLAILTYIGATDGGPANGNGVDYDSNLNGNALEDGAEYDRTPSLDPAKPWRSGPPNGLVSLADALVAIAQVGHSCP